MRCIRGLLGCFFVVVIVVFSFNLKGKLKQISIKHKLLLSFDIMPTTVYNLCKEVIYLNQCGSNIFNMLIRCIGSGMSMTVLHFNQQRDGPLPYIMWV